MKVAIAILAFLIGLCAAASSASAQTTRPAPAAFAQLVQKLADTLVVNDVTALTESLATDATIDGFGETQLAPEKVMIAVSGSMLVSFRAYNQTPSCLATDLAQVDMNVGVGQFHDHPPGAIRTAAEVDVADLARTTGIDAPAAAGGLSAAACGGCTG